MGSKKSWPKFLNYTACASVLLQLAMCYFIATTKSWLHVLLQLCYTSEQYNISGQCGQCKTHM